VSETVTVTDYDECRVSEGLELSLRGRGFVPYPAVPGPRGQRAPREDDADLREGP
jgi:hypothetical protein